VTVADIVLTYAGGDDFERAGIAVFSATGISQTPGDAASSWADPAALSCDAANGSVGVGLAVGSGSGGSFTWVGATEAFDQDDGGVLGVRVSGASFVGGSTQTPRTITADHVGGLETEGIFAVFPADAGGGTAIPVMRHHYRMMQTRFPGRLHHPQPDSHVRRRSSLLVPRKRAA
jgi:hypothetical protein